MNTSTESPGITGVGGMGAALFYNLPNSNYVAQGLIYHGLA